MAFHSYPQLIQAVFNQHWFGPPVGVTRLSPWPWVDHLASRLFPATDSPCSDSLSLRLAQRFASPLRKTSRLIMQKARGQARRLQPRQRPPTACRHTVSDSFHSPHRGSFHLSLTVLVHYRSPSVFSFGEWTPQIPTGLACPVVLKVIDGSLVLFRLRGYHSLCPGFPAPFH